MHSFRVSMTHRFRRIALPALMVLAAAGTQQAYTQETWGLPPDDILARIGSKVITTREYIERMELMPWVDPARDPRQDTVKVQALRSLVAEKLLALEAEELGMGNDERTRAMQDALERALARDELYRKEVMAKVVLPGKQVRDAYRKFAWQLQAIGYGFPDEQAARSFARACRDTAHIDSIVGACRRAGITVSDTITVNFGERDRTVEDALYSLRRPGMTAPVESKTGGWAVFHVLSRETNPACASLSEPDRQRMAEKKLRGRLENDRAALFGEEFFEGKTLHMDSTMFRLMAESMIALVKSDTANHRRIFLHDIDDLRNALAGHLKEPFAVTGTTTLTLEEVLEDLRFYPVDLLSFTRRAIALTMNRTIMQAIEGETYAVEGKARGYHRLPDVRADLDAWHDAWLSQANARRIQLAAVPPDPVDTVRSDTSAAARRRDIRTQERSSALRTHIAALARRYGVELFERKLSTFSIASFTMFTRRTLGFGGVMVAAPMIAPEYQWMEAWKPAGTVAP